MSTNQAKLARKSLDKRLAALRADRLTAPPRGWTKAIRESLGMSTRQLAERMGVSPSRVSTIEKAETTGGVTIKTLRETAAALDCELIYAFVPKKPLDDILYDQAERKARNYLMHMNHTMRLENQEMTKLDIEHEKSRVIRNYLENTLRHLWEKE